MSAFKNAHKKFQRVHQERLQPVNRQKFGFLEKKKDYKKRATDYQDKEKALKTLRQKALDKNPNEFTFHMINSQLKDGRHYEKKAEEMSAKHLRRDVTTDQLKLIQSQDTKYIEFKRKIELEKIAKLEASLHQICLPDKPANKHVIFVHDDDDHDEVWDRVKRIAESFLQRSATGPSKAQLKQYKELKKRKERAAQLSIILDKMRIKSQVRQTAGKRAQKSRDGDLLPARSERQK